MPRYDVGTKVFIEVRFFFFTVSLLGYNSLTCLLACCFLTPFTLRRKQSKKWTKDEISFDKMFRKRKYCVIVLPKRFYLIGHTTVFRPQTQ